MTKLGAWKCFSVVMVFLLILGLAGLAMPLGLARADTVVTFPDANLEAAIRDALGKPSGDIYASELAGLTNFSADSRGIVDLSGLEYCVNLTSLSLYNNRISNLTPLAGLTALNFMNLGSNRINDLTPLAGLINMTELLIYNNQISDLSPLAGLIGLMRVDLSSNQISDLTPLDGLANLDQLYLGSNQISDLSAIAGLTSLTFLTLSPNQISDLTPLSGLTNLTVLELGNNQINDITPLAGLVNLQSLGLGSNQISDLTTLAGLTSLQALTMWSNQISDLSPLSGLTNLQILRIGGNQINNLTPLASLTGLVELDAGSNQISDLTPLAGLVNLQNLYMYNNQISDLTPLAGLPSLQWLGLGSNQIINLSPLAGLTSLKSIDAGNNQISDLTPLSGLISLNQLNFYSNQITDISPLAGLTNLNWLSLNSNQIGNQLAPLTGLNNLYGVDLGNNQISDISQLAGMTNLQYLGLASNLMDNNLVPLTGLTGLQTLDLSSNHISDLTLIGGMTNLRSLYLNSNQIGNQLAPLAGLANLQQLALNFNQISDISLLAGLSNLFWLDLGNNQISDISPVAGMTTLVWLHLNNNQISHLTSLAGLTNLTGLSLENNEISDIQPLVNNPGLAEYDIVWLNGNALNQTSANVYIPALQARGVNVVWDGCVAVNFPDANLEAAVREALNKPTGIIKSTELANLWNLNASNRGIINLSGLEYCTNLNQLDLRDNQISDIEPLVNNSGLATDDIVWLNGNPLSQTSVDTYIPALQARGVIVAWDDPVLVTFPDANLEAAIRDTLDKPSGDIHSSELAALIYLNAGGRGIVNLSGLEYCINLTWLGLYNNQISDLTPLSGLTKLGSGWGGLDLSNNQISNLAPLSGLTNLTWIGLSSNQISELSPLSGLTELSGLKLDSNQISNLAPLTGLSNLQSLYLDNNQINDLTPLAGLTNLTLIGLNSNQISDLTPLANLTILSELYLRYNQVSSLTGISGLTNLHSLYLYGNQIGSLAPLSGLTNLISLDLGSNQISDLTPLAGLTNLSWLSLGSNQISDVTPLAGLINLTALGLGSNQISDLTPVAGLINLYELGLDSNEISDLTPISGLINLRNLYLVSNQINDLTPLSGLTSLAYLYLSNNQISNISPVADLITLSWLDVNNNQIVDIKPLIDGIGLTYGDYLYLMGNPLSQISIDEYIPALKARGVRVFWDVGPTPTPVIEPGETQWHTINTPSVGGEIISPSEVNKIAVAPDAATIWAVDTPAKAIRKSSNLGTVWTDTPDAALHAAMTSAGTPEANQFVWDVAVAPDNTDTVAVVTGSVASSDPAEVWMTTDGGATWESTSFSDVSGGALIGAIDISKDYGNGSDMAVGVRDGAPGAFRLWVLQTASSNSWKLQTAAPSNADILALRFSPSYPVDGSLAVVYCTDNATYYDIAVRDLAPAFNDITNWVFALPGIEVKDPVALSAASPEATTIVNADLELPRDFNGQSLRRAYISLNSFGAATKASTARDGIFRIDDSSVYALMDTSGIADKSICSIAYFGNYAAGKLMAGEILGYPCQAAVPTWFTDSPTSYPIPVWYPALKPATGAAAQGNCTAIDKGGYGNAQVAWTTGGWAYCGTSSADFRNGGVNTALGSGRWPSALRTSVALDESALSLSRNNGETWNQIGLIDTRIDKLTDVAPSADSSTVYLASINKADVAGGGCTGFDSVWRSSSNSEVVTPFISAPVGTIWERVFTHNTSFSCADQQTNIALLRTAAYDDKTGELVAWGVYDPGSSLPHGLAAWSPDYGDYWAMLMPRGSIQDFCFESRSTMYFLNSSGMVQKMVYMGVAWSSSFPSIDCGLGAGYSIAAVPEGKVLVGGSTSSSYPVSYSADAAGSFMPINETLNSGNMLVAFDSNFAANGVIYAATQQNPGGSIYRNTLPAFGQWTDLKPLQLGYCGLATSSKGPLYAANPLFVERTLNPAVSIPGDNGEWDALISDLSDFSVRLGLQPNSLKLSEGQTWQATPLYFVDDRDYNPQASAGQLWTYTDCLALATPQSMEVMSITCDPATHRPPMFSLSWMPGCFEKFYELQIAEDADFTTGVWSNPWYQPSDNVSPSLLIPPGGIPAIVENSPGWVGTLPDAVLNVLGITPNMPAIGLEPTISLPPLEPKCGHKYFWRLRAVGSVEGDIIRSPWSATQSFTIGKAPPSVASVASATGTGMVTFSSDIGIITNLTAIAEGTLPTEGKPDGVGFPHGLFAFDITVIDPGATATITITFPSPLPEGVQYWKYQEDIGWYQIPILSHNDNVIIIQLTDGGVGDTDGIANRMIVDPGGPPIQLAILVPNRQSTPSELRTPRRVSPSPAKPQQLPPPDVRLNNVSVNPSQAQAGKPVTILANLTNNGGSSGSYNVVLVVNGRMEQQRTVEVSPGSAYPVRFTVTKSQPGTYNVSVGDKNGSFVILKAGARQDRDPRAGPALTAATIVIALLLCLVILVYRRRQQWY